VTDRLDPRETPDFEPDEASQGLRSADVLGVLAVSTFLAAIGLVTFFVTATFGP